MRQCLLTYSAVAVVLAAGAAAAEDGKPTTPAGTSESAAGELKRTLLSRPPVPVTPIKGPAPPGRPAPLPAEGAMVVDRLCRLVREPAGQWVVLRFDAEPSRRPAPPRRALPCALLERLEALAARSPGAVFRVSGETTVYRGRAYLLLTKATALDAPPAPASQPASAPAGAEPSSRPVGDAGREPTSDDILKRLLGEKVGRPIAAGGGAAATRPAAPAAPGMGRPLAVGPSGMVIDRLVRFVREDIGPWWQARFEADNTLQEPPLRLLPCGLLERTERKLTARRVGPEPLLRVSGVVTRYRGRRYLLLRKVLPERRMGRF